MFVLLKLILSNAATVDLVEIAFGKVLA